VGKYTDIGKTYFNWEIYISLQSVYLPTLNIMVEFVASLEGG